jgi:hypothetical protein
LDNFLLAIEILIECPQQNHRTKPIGLILSHVYYFKTYTILIFQQQQIYLVMKFYTFLVVAACASFTNAKFRAIRKEKIADSKNRKKMNKKSPSSMLMMQKPAFSEEELDGAMHYLKENILTIEGLEPGMELTPAETEYLEDLILTNLNDMDDAQDIANGEKKYHTILFSGNELDRKLSTVNQYGWGEICVYTEYSCAMCQHDDDDWILPTKTFTVPPKLKKKATKAPTQAPTAARKKIALKGTIGKMKINLCKGASRSSFFRLRKINTCHFK